LLTDHSYLRVFPVEGVVTVDRREVERRMARFTDAARDKGVKLTHQRLEIFREVASSIDHPPVEAVFRAVRTRLPTVSLDTVYRTLWLLEDLGVVTTLGPRRGTVRFDANLRQHHHFVCVRCGMTRDFEDASFDALRVPPAVEQHGDMLATRVEVRGVCRRCSRRKLAAGTRHRNDRRSPNPKKDQPKESTDVE
jgi:Fur family peroxide stress response transcriptional regulator